MINLKSKKKILSAKEYDQDALSTIVTNIQYSSLNKTTKSIVVTSSNLKEGKTVVACNLAISFSQNNKKVLLLDCDFRNSNIHNIFNVTNTIGLSDILLGKHTIEDCIQSCEIKDLYILTSGSKIQNPTQLLSNIQMIKIMSELKNSFDLIILDAPPILYFADTQILSAINDGTIIVSKYRQTDKDSIIKCKEIVDKVGGRILGSIINDVPKKFSLPHNRKSVKFIKL